MRFFLRLIGTIIANGIGIFLAARYVPGFELSGDFREIMILALLLTAFNIVLKPILKLLFGPIIVLTLGFGLIIVNALIIFLLDFAVENLTIVSIPAFIYSAIIISIVNILVHLLI